MFSDASRYRSVGDYTVPGPDGRPVRIKRTRPTPPTTGTLVYRVRAGDRLDLIAYRMYRSAGAWWRIADAAPETLNPVLLMTPGTPLTIPPAGGR
jgi:hypothetical protein